MSQQPLDYQVTTTAGPRSTVHRVGAAAVGTFAGAVLTVPAILFAAASAGAGHGHYGFARLSFPIPLLLTLTTGNRITDPLIALSFAQFPLYGLLLGLAAAVGRRALVFAVAGLGLWHAVAVTLCFARLIPNFS